MLKYGSIIYVFFTPTYIFILVALVKENSGETDVNYIVPILVWSLITKN